MTLKQLADHFSVTERTIRKRLLDIKGIVISNGDITVPVGTRYPYNLRRSNIKSRDGKRRALLEATDTDKFIDHEMLKMDKISFESMLKELVEEGLLIQRNSDNSFGANMYDTSMYYPDFKREQSLIKKKDKAVVAGSFVGATVNQIMDN